MMFQPERAKEGSKETYPTPVVSYITMKVFDILGREVATLVNEVKQPGYHNVQWSTDNGQLSSGVYFYRLQAGEFVAARKLLLMK